MRTLADSSSATRILDGRAVAKDLKTEVLRELEPLREAGLSCGLATAMVGTDYAAAAYERRLRRSADEIGILYRHYRMAADSGADEVAGVVRQLGADASVHAVLLLRPLPAHIPEPELFAQLDPFKDVEALHPENAGLLALSTPRFVPSTPASVFHLLDRWLDATGRDRARFYRGATIVVVGRSNNVGKPAPALAQARNAVVVDVVVNPIADPDTERVRLVGDVDLSAVLDRVCAVTPVPGGVGPVTDVWSMHNSVDAARAVHCAGSPTTRSTEDGSRP